MAIENFISTVWSESLYQALNKKYIAASNSNREFEGEIRKKGSVVKICGLEPVTIYDYTRGEGIYQAERLSDNFRELKIDQAKYFNFQIDDIDQLQGSPRMMDLAMKNAANALADVADKYIYSLYEQAGIQVSDGGSLDSNSLINTMIEARTRLLENNADPEDIVFEISPMVSKFLLQAKISVATDNTDALENGCVGSIGGCKVYVSNNVAVDDQGNIQVHYCIARTKRAIAFAEQLSEIEAYRPQNSFSDAVKGLHLYGAKVVYPEEMATMSFHYMPD